MNVTFDPVIPLLLLLAKYILDVRYSTVWDREELQTTRRLISWDTNYSSSTFCTVRSWRHWGRSVCINVERSLGYTVKKTKRANSRLTGIQCSHIIYRKRTGRIQFKTMREWEKGPFFKKTKQQQQKNLNTYFQSNLHRKNLFIHSLYN